MVKVILFDLDGTLFDRDAAVRELFADQHRAFAGALAGVPREPFIERLLELDQHGHADKRMMYAVLVRELGLDASLGDRLLEHFRDVYSHFGATFSDVLPTLEALRARGLALGLVSNGRVDTQAAKVARLGLEPLLDAVLISEREGVRKPDRRIFERALGRLGAAPAEAWHVGDHPHADVAGARAAGLTAVWRYVPYWPEPATRAFTIFTLAELVPLLGAALARRPERSGE
jgi:putative hydrolase of the HAD superfamily